MPPILTGIKDKEGDEISIGDILESDDGYYVLVCQFVDEKGRNGNFYGSLICELNNPCRNIPYSIHRGIGYKAGYRIISHVPMFMKELK